MKYQKATVSIINLGNEDILTCSGEWNVGCPTTGKSQTKIRRTLWLGLGLGRLVLALVR